VILLGRGNPDAVVNDCGGFVSEHEDDLLIEVNRCAAEEEPRVRARLGDGVEHEVEGHFARRRLLREEGVGAA